VTGHHLTLGSPIAAAEIRRSVIGIYSVLGIANVLVWAWAVYLFRHQPLLLGTALLAYSFGLRHAVDADHIAAIDNVTRKLMQTGQRPVTVGFYFALGHSAVVVIAALGIVATTSLLTNSFQHFQGLGGIIATVVSASFLFLIAGINLVILHSVWKTYHHVRRGGAFDAMDFDLLLNKRGLLSRFFRPLFKLISQSWHMFPLGFLFGLGFDTATEVALLGISATQAAHGMSVWAIMVFPALFAAGMSLVDTTDNILMLGAYGWAFVKPIRKLYYNITITSVSVIVAFVVGGIEALGLLSDRLHPQGAFWKLVDEMNGNFGVLGYFIVALFALSWVASIAFYRWRRFDLLEVEELVP